MPPYTFVATVNAVLLHHALPVFVDTDPETFQIDARKIEAAINERTRCIIPVHMGGAAADLDTIAAVAARHKLPVLEDACQAHLAEWKGRKVSTLGDLGCFSFQGSKNLNSGEGGAILTNSDDLIEQCKSFQNNGRGTSTAGFSYVRNERQPAHDRVPGRPAVAAAHAARRAIPPPRAKCGLLDRAPPRSARHRPSKNLRRLHAKCLSSLHVPLRSSPVRRFAPRRFLEALHAEGIPASGGYQPLDKEPFLKNTLQSRGFQAIYGRDRLSEYLEKTHCPANDQLCEVAVWLTQTMLLGPRSDMDQIAEAVRKVQKNGSKLAKA